MTSTLPVVDSGTAPQATLDLRHSARGKFSTTDLTKTPVDLKSPFGDDITATVAVFELDEHGVPQQAFAPQPTSTFDDWRLLDAGQFYVSPREIVVPGGAQSLVVIELSVGNTNKQSIAWKIDTRRDIRVDCMGPYGGAAFYEVHSTVGVSAFNQVPIADPYGDRSRDRAQVQATFSMSNAVTQSTPQTSPALAVQLQGGFDPSSDTNFAGSLQFGPFGWWPIEQSSPPAAVFAVSFNAFISVSAQLSSAQTTALADLPDAAHLQTVLDFGADLNTTLPAPELAELWRWVAALGTPLLRAIRSGEVTVRVRASASPTGEQPQNVSLSQSRAGAVRVALAGNSSGSGTTGGFLGSEQVKFQLLALGDFARASETLRTGDPANGKQAQVFIDRAEAIAAIVRQLGNPPPGP